MLLDSATSDGLTVTADVVLGIIVITAMLCIDFALGFQTPGILWQLFTLGVDDVCFAVCSRL